MFLNEGYEWIVDIDLEKFLIGKDDIEKLSGMIEVTAIK